jgi:acyl-CoA thioester hydrolase
MKLELPQDKKLVFESTLPIRWGDMDAMGRSITERTALDSVRFRWSRTTSGVRKCPTKLQVA